MNTAQAPPENHRHTAATSVFRSIKNRFQTDDDIQAKKVAPSSWMDWMKALLVFPVSVVFLYVGLPE